MNRFIKSIFLGILTFLLVSAGIFLPLAYNFYRSGQSRLAELQRQVENRGVELSLALARLATEQWGPKGMVSVSSAMYEVVRATAGRTDEVLVKEIFVIDREGKVRAHNDFTRLAEDAEFDYDRDFQEKILRLSDRNPVWHIKTARFDAKPYYLPLFQRAFPDLIQNRWTFGAAVFSLDGPIHWGGLHMKMEVYSVERVMLEMVNDLIYNVVIALLVSLVVTVVVVGLASLLGRGGAPAGTAPGKAAAGGATPAESAAGPVPFEGLEPYEDEEVEYRTYATGYDEDEEMEDPYADQSLAGGRILDAIPLERTRRDRRPVGYN